MAGFAGDAADFYAQYRRGYPAPVIDLLVEAMDLSPADTVLDLGCGTGQLTIPLAGRVGRMLGVDPEPDMLELARSAEPANSVHWIRGAATDLPDLAAEHGPLSAITLANVIHLLDRNRLFADARRALGSGGRLALIANGTPLWLQDSDWSRALGGFLETWFGVRSTNHCGTDPDSRRRFRAELTDLGWRTDDIEMNYPGTLTGQQIIGGVFSALSDRVPVGAERDRFTMNCLAALAPHAPFHEQIAVRVLVGTAGH